MIGELLTIAFSVALGGVFAWKLGARFTRPERSLLWWAWGAHILAAFAKVVIVYDYYGFGDMRTYLMESETIAAFIRADPERWLGPYLRFGLHQDVQVPYVPMGSGGPTQTMFVFAGLFQLVAGPSKYGVSVFVAAFSFASKVALYSVFRAHFPQRFHGRIAVATLLIPSAVFWSASLSKEGVLWMSCGWVLYGFHRAAFERRWVSGAVIAVLAAALSSLVKAYVLMPMAVGAAVWMFWRSERGPGRQPNPLRAFLLATVLIAGAIGFVVGFGALFPRYSVAAFADGAAELQQLGAGISDQGSYYSLGAGSGALGQVRAAPVAVLTALFRPMVFEARNPLMLAASLENAAFLFLTLYVFYTRRFGVFRTIWRSPALMFCAIYVVALAAATGLTSTNLGTLSRYRMPLIPYFGVMLAVLVPMAPRPGRIRGAAGTGRRARTVVPLRAERASAP